MVDEFSSAGHELMFFLFMIILIVFVLAGFVGVFSGAVVKIRSVVQQLINVVFVVFPLYF